MIISKKKFDEAIESAKRSIADDINRERRYEDNWRWAETRFADMARRMDIAFADIDKRLTELESQSAKVVYDSGVACNCPKY